MFTTLSNKYAFRVRAPYIYPRISILGISQIRIRCARMEIIPKLYLIRPFEAKTKCLFLTGNLITTGGYHTIFLPVLSIYNILLYSMQAGTADRVPAQPPVLMTVNCRAPFAMLLTVPGIDSHLNGCITTLIAYSHAERGDK